MASRAIYRVMGWVLAGIAAVVLLSCERGTGGQTQADGTKAGGGETKIVVTVPPLMWAVRGLAPEGSEVTLIVPPGASAHGYELTPSQAAAIAGADVVVMVGLGLEPRVEAALAAHANADRRVVRFADVVGDDAVGEEHDHAHHDGHHHHGADPHAWLDPVLMGRFVEMVGEAMPRGNSRPGEHARRAATLQAECASMDAAYRAALGRVASKTVIAQHNAYAYLTARYGLTIRPIIEGGGGHGGEPTPGEIVRAVSAIRGSGARAVFVEPQMNDASARRVADAAGVEVLTLDPLGDGDWPAMMRENLTALIAGLGGSEDAGG